MNIEKKRENEKEMLRTMITVYCRGVHKTKG